MHLVASTRVRRPYASAACLSFLLSAIVEAIMCIARQPCVGLCITLDPEQQHCQATLTGGRCRVVSFTITHIAVVTRMPQAGMVTCAECMLVPVPQTKEKTQVAPLFQFSSRSEGMFSRSHIMTPPRHSGQHPPAGAGGGGGISGAAIRRAAR